MKDNSKVIVNLLTGMAVGAVLGVLLAPAKGRSSRTKIDLFLTNLGDTISDNAVNRYNLLENFKDGLKYSIKHNMDDRAGKL